MLRRLRLAAILAVAAAAGVLAATAITAVASTNVSVSPRDNCGGFNGHVVYGAASIQLYGQVWDNSCSGSTSVWLAWDSPGYHNVQTQTANQSQTQGVSRSPPRGRGRCA